MTTLGYLGPKGTFTEVAYHHYVHTHQLDCTPVIAESMHHLFSLFKSNACDGIVFPVENSIEGVVSCTMDLTVENKHGHITEEIILPIKHCLLSQKNTQKKDITHILSHTQALAQCSSYIQHHFPNAQLLPVASTATAASWVSDTQLRPGNLQNCTCAAIGNEGLSSLYDLHIIDDTINDISSNQTRFFVLSHNETHATGHDKTSIVFTTKKNVPGSLFMVMEEFYTREINLTHIASRPQKSHLGEYLFFIDFEGHQSDNLVKDVLKAIKEKTLTLTILGSYKKGKVPC